MTRVEPVVVAPAPPAGPERGEALLDVRGLCKHFPLKRRGLVPRTVGWSRAVDDVSFVLGAGETLGLVGESGSGKTTLVRTLLRAYQPTAGEVRFRARAGWVDLAALPARALKPLRRELQMIFQDPYSSLNPRMTVGRIVGEPLLVHGLGTAAEREARVAELLRRVGLSPDHASRYPHAFSGGQRQRIGIARALVLGPSLVVADEAVSALDVSVQAQILNLLQELQLELGVSYLFVSHDLAVVRHLCDRVAVLYAGRVVEVAPRAALFGAPLHPYTRALLAAAPSLDPDERFAATLEGEVADPAGLPPGCAFEPRCGERVAACARERPPLDDVGEGRQVACLLRRGGADAAGGQPPG